MLAVDAATWIARMALKGTGWLAWKAAKGTAGAVGKTAQLGWGLWKEKRGPPVAKEEGAVGKRLRTWREKLYEKSGKLAAGGRNVLDKLEERDRARRIRLSLKHGGAKWAKDPWWYKPRADDEIRQAEEQLAEVRRRHGAEQNGGGAQQESGKTPGPGDQQPTEQKSQGSDGNGKTHETAKGGNEEPKRGNGQERERAHDTSDAKVEQAAARAAQANGGAKAHSADTERGNGTQDRREGREAPSDARAHQRRRRGAGAATAAKMHGPGARGPGAATAAKMRNGGFSSGRETPVNGTRFEKRGAQAAAAAAKTHAPTAEPAPTRSLGTKAPSQGTGGLGM